jgi:methylmalonyl-CoA carboxyltransferase large subunit
MATQSTEQIQKTMDERIAELRARRERTQLGGGKTRIEKQHKGGKLSARERIERLVDADSFQEIGLFAEHRATLFGISPSLAAPRARSIATRSPR